MNQSKSSKKSITSGVPQGSVLGPILFLMYMYDFPRHKKTKFTMFADDTAITSSEKDEKLATSYLQEHLDILNPYYWKWKIRVNATKSEHICFTRRRQTTESIQLTFNNSLILQKKSVKYLGVVLQSNMKFNLQTTEAIKKAKNTTTKLWCLIGPRSKLSVVNKLTIYKLFTRSALTYNIHIWYNTSMTNKQKIQTYQNKVIRLCLNMRPHPITHRQVRNEVIHQQSHIPTVSEFCKKISNNFRFGCLNHENEIIKSLFSHTMP